MTWYEVTMITSGWGKRVELIKAGSQSEAIEIAQKRWPSHGCGGCRVIDLKI
jgi:hypothetical protein